jgi:hypothetical protein
MKHLNLFLPCFVFQLLLLKHLFSCSFFEIHNLKSGILNIYIFQFIYLLNLTSVKDNLKIYDYIIHVFQNFCLNEHQKRCVHLDQKVPFVLACFQVSAMPRLENSDSDEKDALFGPCYTNNYFKMV